MKLDSKKTIYVGLAFLIICMFWQVYDNIIAKMLINSFGFDQTWSGVIMALDNVLALILLPVFGAISDRTKTNSGRRTPFIKWGVIISALLITGIALFDAMQLNAVKAANISDITSVTKIIGNEEVKFYMFNGILYETNELAVSIRQPLVWEVTMNNIFYLVAFIGILFFVLIAMATYRTPAVALMPDVTPKPLRSKANAIINLMGTVGGIISLILMAFLAKDFKNYIILFIILAVSMILLLFAFLNKVNEPKLVEEMNEQSKKYGLEEQEEKYVDQSDDKMPRDVLKSFLLIMASIIFWFMAYNAATTKFSIYSQIILDMGFAIPLLVAQVTAVIFYIPIGNFASKIGRKKTILYGIIILTFAFFLGWIATDKTTFLIYLTMGLAGLGWAAINVNSYPMVVEMSKGSNIGKYTGYYYTASMSAQIVTPIFSGLFLDSKIGNFGMRSLFPYAIVFCIFAFITMMFVKHGDSKPIPKKSIEVYESLDD